MGKGQNRIPNSELVGLEPERCFFPLQEIHKAFFLNFSVRWWRRWFWHMLANDDDWRDCGCFLSKEAVCVETKYTWQPTCLQSEFKAQICSFFLWCKSFFHLLIFTFFSLAPSPSPSRFPQSHLFWTDLPKYCLKYLAHMCHSRTTKGSYCILCTVFTLFLRCKWHHCMFSADCCSLVILVFTLYW